MKKLQAIISSAILLIVICSTILQYHHHDSHGRMCMINTEDICLNETIAHNQSHSMCDDKCHRSDHPDQSDDSNCTLKLSIVKANKQFSLGEHQFSFIVLHNILSLFVTHEDIAESVKRFSDISFILPDTHLSSSQLRAPPTV